MATICNRSVAPHACRGMLAGCVALLILFAAPTATAAVDIFLKADGIEGESIAEGHEKEIDVLHMNWGMTNPGSMHMATGGGAGKVRVEDITFTHYVDRASPVFMNLSCTGKYIRSATFTFRIGGNDRPFEFYVIELESVLVSSVQVSVNEGDGRPVEHVSLNFATFKVSYTEPPFSGAKSSPSVDFGFKINENVEY